MRLWESISRRRQCRCKTDYVIGIFAAVSRTTVAAARLRVWASYGNMAELYVHAPPTLGLIINYFVSFLSQFLWVFAIVIWLNHVAVDLIFWNYLCHKFRQTGSTNQCLPGRQSLCSVTGATNQSTDSVYGNIFDSSHLVRHIWWSPLLSNHAK